MVVGNRGRGVQEFLFSPIAKLLLGLGVTPNAVTVTGTALTVIAALGLLPLGFLVSGSLTLGVLVLTDSVDGIMARKAGTSTRYGAFLDSTLDRLSDAAIFAGITLWFALNAPAPWRLLGLGAGLACISFGAMVSYVRAKAEALGVDASMGLAERSDRIIIVLVSTLLTGLGLPVGIFVGALWVLAALSAFTVIQRMVATRKGLATVVD